MIGLTWSDVNLRKKEITIKSQLIYKNYGDGCKFHVSLPKTAAGIRIIPMQENVQKAFESQKKLNFMQGIHSDFEVDGKNGFIFMSKYGRPLMPNAINNVLYNIVDAYNKKEMMIAQKEKRRPELLPNISAHCLRHTFCTRMAGQGMDIRVLQYIMGHASIEVTMNIYNHITSRSRIENEIEKINQKAV